MPSEQETKLTQFTHIVPGEPFSIEPSLSDMRIRYGSGLIMRGERKASIFSEGDTTFEFRNPVGVIKYFDNAEMDHHVEFPLRNPGPTLDELRRKFINNLGLLPVTFSIQVTDVLPEYSENIGVNTEIEGILYEGNVARPIRGHAKPAQVNIYTWFHEGLVAEKLKPYTKGFTLLFAPEQMSDFASRVKFTFTK